MAGVTRINAKCGSVRFRRDRIISQGSHRSEIQEVEREDHD